MTSARRARRACSGLPAKPVIIFDVSTFLLTAQVYFGRMHRVGWARPLLGLLLLLLIGTAVAVAIWAIARSSSTSHPYPPPPAPVDPAMEILRARFAKGEIDAQEFAARAAQLSGSMASPTPPTPGAPPA